MPDNLARFERFSRAAYERGASGRAARDAERAEIEREWAAEEEASRQSPYYLAGPPDGCHECWEWRRAPSGPGFWWGHREPPEQETRPFALWEGGEEEPTVHCTHACHGPEGYPLPVIAYA